MKKMFLLIVSALFFLSAGSALANKSTVRLEAPVNAAQGEKIKITLFVTHSANNFFHHFFMPVHYCAGYCRYFFNFRQISCHPEW